MRRTLIFGALLVILSEPGNAWPQTTTEDGHDVNAASAASTVQAENTGKKPETQAEKADSASERNTPSQAARHEAALRFVSGMAPPGVKGLKGGVQVGALLGDFEGDSALDDFTYYMATTVAFNGELHYGLSERVTFLGRLQLARPSAMFHATSGVFAGVRYALTEGKRLDVPWTLAARVGLVAKPGFLGTVWNTGVIPEEGIATAAGLGMLRVDTRLPVMKRGDWIWYLSGEVSMEGDILRRETYQTNGSVEKSSGLNIYSYQCLAGFGGGKSTTGKDLVTQMELVGGFLTYPESLGVNGGLTPIIYFRVRWGALSANDLTHNAPP